MDNFIAAPSSFAHQTSSNFAACLLSLHPQEGKNNNFKLPSLETGIRAAQEDKLTNQDAGKP